MKYEHIVKGQFLERPNRFVARVRIEDREETVHVKNTGRCRELLPRDAVVYLEKCGGAKDRTGGRAAAGRVTAYDLVAVEKGDRLINMDSQAPNRAVGEWLRREDFSAAWIWCARRSGMAVPALTSILKAAVRGYLWR